MTGGERQTAPTQWTIHDECLVDDTAPAALPETLGRLLMTALHARDRGAAVPDPLRELHLGQVRMSAQVGELGAQRCPHLPRVTTPMMRAPKRIAVIGSAGSGKSTVAATLARSLGLPLIHLDEHYYRAGWEPLSMSEWRSVHDELVAGAAWVMDGNYKSTLPARLRATDTVVFLDSPGWLCLWRVLVRRLRWLGRRAPGMADGCVERLDRRTPQFLRYVWGYPRTMRPQVLGLLADRAHGAQVVHLASRGQVRRFLAALPPAAGGLSTSHSVQELS